MALPGSSTYRRIKELIEGRVWIRTDGMVPGQPSEPLSHPLIDNVSFKNLPLPIKDQLFREESDLLRLLKEIENFSSLQVGIEGLTPSYPPLET